MEPQKGSPKGKSLRGAEEREGPKMEVPMQRGLRGEEHRGREDLRGKGSSRREVPKREEPKRGNLRLEGPKGRRLTGRD